MSAPQPPLLPAKTATRVKTKTVVAVSLIGFVVAAAAFAISFTLQKRNLLPRRTIYKVPAGYMPGYTPGYVTPGYTTPPPPAPSGPGRRDGR